MFCLTSVMQIPITIHKTVFARHWSGYGALCTTKVVQILYLTETLLKFQYNFQTKILFENKSKLHDSYQAGIKGMLLDTIGSSPFLPWDSLREDAVPATACLNTGKYPRYEGVDFH